MSTRTEVQKAPAKTKQTRGKSNRVTCADCDKPTNHRHRCETCTKVNNLRRQKRRKEWGEEGRCVCCSRIVTTVNPKSNDLYATCDVCRSRILANNRKR